MIANRQSASSGPHSRFSNAPAPPPQQPAVLAARTGPLDILKGKRVLVVTDNQNLEMSAQKLGCKVSYRKLAETLGAAAQEVWLHAVYARTDPEDRSRWGYLQERNWNPHPKTTRVFRRGGVVVKREANADNHFAAIAFGYCLRLPVDLVVLGTGDGKLAEDVAELLLSELGRPTATLSFATSTAARLNYMESNLITANITVGFNCVRIPGIYEKNKEATPEVEHSDLR
jgi:hypothetical protein